MWILIALLASQRPVTEDIGDWIHQVWENHRTGTFYQYLINPNARADAAIGVAQKEDRFVIVLRFSSWLRCLDLRSGSGFIRVGEHDPEATT